MAKKSKALSKNKKLKNDVNSVNIEVNDTISNNINQTNQFKSINEVDLINEVEIERNNNRVNEVVLDLTVKPTDNDLEKTFNYLQNNYQKSHDVLSERTAKMSQQSSNVKRQMSYIGFVYYIWNPNNLNIKIIPLIHAYPILDIVNLQEFYYLQKPSMFVDGKPIWIVIRGITVSFELSIKEVIVSNGKKGMEKRELQSLLREIELEGYTPEEIRAKLQSMFATYLFGKPSFQLKDYLVFILILALAMVIEYLIIGTIFRGA